MTTQSFSYTGAVQYWKVPPGITSIEVEMWGAEGGKGATSGTTLLPLGGKGGYVKAQVDVTPGDIIEIYTPGKGTNGILYTGVGSTVALGGFPTSTGAQQNTGYNGSAGGGGQAIVIKQTLGWRVFAGGGGGGGVVAGTSTGHTPVGGDGGFAPTDGVGDPASPFSPSSGGGGTSAGPGGNRYFSDTQSSGGTTGSASNAMGAGGGGGFPLGNGGGAANGGPYKGGGGRGGTSWSLGSEVTIIDDATGVRTGNGAVNITWGAPSHCAVFEGLVTDVVNAGNVQLSLATNSLPGSVTDYRIDFLANTTGNATPTSGLLNSGPWTLGPMAAGTYVRYAVSRVDGAHINGSAVMRATDTAFGLTWDLTVRCPGISWGFNLSFGQRGPGL